MPRKPKQSMSAGNNSAGRHNGQDHPIMLLTQTSTQDAADCFMQVVNQHPRQMDVICQTLLALSKLALLGENDRTGLQSLARSIHEAQR